MTVIDIGFVDSGGSGYCLNLALTSDFARLFVLLRLRHGFGIFPVSFRLVLGFFLVPWYLDLGYN